MGSNFISAWTSCPSASTSTSAFGACEAAGRRGRSQKDTINYYKISTHKSTVLYSAVPMSMFIIGGGWGWGNGEYEGRGRREWMQKLTWDETKTCKGPTMAKKPICHVSLRGPATRYENMLTLLTLTTFASTTSPLKGFITTAV